MNRFFVVALMATCFAANAALETIPLTTNESGRVGWEIGLARSNINAMVELIPELDSKIDSASNTMASAVALKQDALPQAGHGELLYSLFGFPAWLDGASSYAIMMHNGTTINWLDKPAGETGSGLLAFGQTNGLHWTGNGYPYSYNGEVAARMKIPASDLSTDYEDGFYGVTVQNGEISFGEIQDPETITNDWSEVIAAIPVGDPAALSGNLLVTSTAPLTLVVSNGLVYAVLPNGDMVDVTYYLPAYAVTEPTTNYPAGFAAFDFEANTTNVSASAPQIAEWTRQAQPGDTIAVSAENMDPNNALAVFADMDGNVYAGDIIRLDGRLLAITLPSGLPVNEQYLMWLYNSYGFGEPVGINQTEQWWVGPDRVWTGQVFSVYGQNLTFDGSSYLYIENYGWLSTTNCNPYKADFTVPSDMTNGTYVVHAHNGYGGKYGWDPASLGTSLIIAAPLEWSDDTNTWYNVKAYGATGDGVTDDYASIIAAVTAAKSGSIPHTVFFPAGTYLVKTGISPNDDFLRYKGEGVDVSIIQGSSDTWSGTSTGILVFRNDSCAEDLTIIKGDVVKTPLLGQGGSGRNRLRRVKLSCLSPGPLQKTDGAEVLDISLGVGQYIIEDCVFITDNAIDLGVNRQFIFRNCEFIAAGDCNGLVSFFGSESSFDGCSAHPYNVSDTTDGTGWGKGRWVYGGGTVNKVYIGGNESTNMAPRLPDIEFWGTSTNVIQTSTANTTSYFYFAEASITGTLSSVKLPAEMTVNSPPSVVPRGYKIVSINTNTLVVGIKRDWYTGTFPTNNYSTIKETVDQNSGEQFLWEAMNAYFRGYPITVLNSTTLAFADLSGVVGETFAIVDGKGAGQMRKCTFSKSTGIVTLEKPLRVLPDTNSLCKIGKFLDRVVMYDNDLYGMARVAVPDVYTATTGFNCYGGASRWIVDNNRFGLMKTGVMAWANSDTGINQIIQPHLFNLLQNNTIDNCQVGIAQTIQDWARAVPKDPTYYGNVLRGNLIINSTVDALSESTSSGRMQKDLCIFEDNTFSSNAVFLASSKSNIYNQVWIENTIEGNGETAFTPSDPNSYLMISNSLSGFGTNYAGANVGPLLSVPQSTVLLSDASKTIQLLNVGTTGLTYTATDNAAWLSVTASGAIAAESSGDMVLSRSGSTTNGATALVSVVAAGQTNVFTVVYGTELGVE